MAQKTALDAMVERRLRSVRRNFEALPYIEERWQRARREGREDSDDVVVDKMGFRAEWDDLIDRLDCLQDCYARGEMTPDQRRAYEETLPLIREMLPIIARQDLTPPRRGILDQMAATTGIGADIDFYLWLVRRRAETLPRVERHRADSRLQATFTDDELLAEEIGIRDEWRDLMHRLEHELHAPFQAGRMSAVQTDQYRALLALVRELLPVTERLRLAPPSDAVLADTASAAPHPAKTA